MASAALLAARTSIASALALADAERELRRTDAALAVVGTARERARYLRDFTTGFTRALERADERADLIS